LKELLQQAADLLESKRGIREAEHAIALLTLTEVLGVEVVYERLQDVTFELLREDAVSSWPTSLRERLARLVGVEDTAKS
jgi:hypothetical protein